MSKIRDSRWNGAQDGRRIAGFRDLLLWPQGNLGLFSFPANEIIGAGKTKGTGPFTRCEGDHADELWTPVQGLSRFAASTLAIRRAGLEPR